MNWKVYLSFGIGMIFSIIGFFLSPIFHEIIGLIFGGIYLSGAIAFILMIIFVFLRSMRIYENDKLEMILVIVVSFMAGSFLYLMLHF